MKSIYGFFCFPIWYGAPLGVLLFSFWSQELRYKSKDLAKPKNEVPRLDLVFQSLIELTDRITQNFDLSFFFKLAVRFSVFIVWSCEF